MQGGSFWNLTVASLALISPKMCSGRHASHMVSMFATGVLQYTLYVYLSTTSAWSTPATNMAKFAICCSMMKL